MKITFVYFLFFLLPICLPHIGADTAIKSLHIDKVDIATKNYCIHEIQDHNHIHVQSAMKHLEREDI